MISRAERSAFADWWWTVDRWLLAAIGLLVVLGIVLTMAGSPPVAERLGLSTFFFVHHQVMFLVPSLCLMLATSFLQPRDVRRAGLLVFVGGMALIGCRAGVRPRGEGRPPLDLRHPALGIRQARLRDPRRLGLLGGRAAPRRAGQPHRPAAAARSPSCR